ncbi:MAG: hypothetical protein E7666_04225 [Ruminococcaceae bacterium]|nr:hypothetical protein [Oscillospiraceae bacterium]
MKKLFCIVLCLLTLCACGCTQKPAQYYAYMIDVPWESTFYKDYQVDCSPSFPNIEADRAYRDDSAEQICSVELCGRVMEGTYQDSTQYEGGTVYHRYLSSAENQQFTVDQNGTVRKIHFLDPIEQDSTEYLNRHEFIVATRSRVKEITGVDVTDYRVEALESDLKLTSTSWGVRFTKYVNGYATNDSVYISLYPNGELHSISATPWFGNGPDSVDVSFDEQMMYRAIDARLEIAFEQATKELGEMVWYVEKAPLLYETEDGTPYLIVEVRISYMRETAAARVAIFLNELP